MVLTCCCVLGRGLGAVGIAADTECINPKPIEGALGWAGIGIIGDVAGIGTAHAG